MNDRLYYTDRPSDVDALGFTDYRPALVEVITRGETPLTIGIFGSWGTGKTSLLRMLRQDLRRKWSPHFRTVWFTAWKYERTEALWRAFILRVLDALYPRKEDPEPPEERERIPFEKLAKEQQEQVERLQRLEESVYRTVEWEEFGRLVVDWGKLAREGGEAIAELAAAFLPGAPVLRKILKRLGGKEDDQGIIDALHREVHTHRLEQLTSMEQFEATFQRVLRDILGPEGRLVVFVDDLDRCLPEKAVEVLEAIKLFLEVEGTVFVLGLDREVICRGIEVYYRRQGSEVPISGDDYLEKFIQIPFHLPPLDAEDMERLLEAAERGAQEPEWVDLERYAEERRIDQTVRRILARGVRPNPRQAKRALNAFRLLQDVALVREARGTLPPDTSWPILAKIVVLQTQYPEIYSRWLEPGMQDLPVHLECALETGEAPPEAPERVHEAIQNVLRDPVRSYHLREVLTYPPDGEGRTGRRRAYFRDLKGGELKWYRRLAAPLIPPPTMKWASLLEEILASGDPARLWQVALKLRKRPPEEQEYACWLLLKNRPLPEWVRRGVMEILRAGNPVLFLIEVLNDACIYRQEEEKSRDYLSDYIPPMEVLGSAVESVSEVFRAAEETLRSIQDPAAVGLLLEALQSVDEEEVRQIVIEVLVNIGAAAIRPLLEALQDEDAGIRQAAAEALGAIRDPAAVGPLVEALRDADADVRRAAAEALGAIGDPAAVGPLVEALRDRVEVRRAAVSALGAIRDPAAVGPLVDALRDADAVVRRAAAVALGAIRDPAAVGPLVEALQDANFLVRLVAVWALGTIGDPAAVGPLVEALQDANALMRKMAAERLGAIRDPVAVGPLVEALRDADADVRRAAAEALGAIGDPAAVGPLVEALRDRVEVRRAAVSALGAIRDPAAVDPLLEALRDVKKSVRQAAAEALKKIGDPRGLEAVREARERGLL